MKKLATILLSLMLPVVSPAQGIAPPPANSLPLATSNPAGAAPLARDTTTGKEFEALVRLKLEKLGYEISEQVQVGTRPNGGKHMIDIVARRDGKSYLISLKWQQTSGTAEQKVPYELICLSEALKQSRGAHQSAYLVLGGEGWSLKEFYLSGGLNRHMKLDQPVTLLDLQGLLKRAQNKQL